MFRLLKAATITSYLPENDTAVAIRMITKSMTDVSPFHKVYVKVASGIHFYNAQSCYSLLMFELCKCKNFKCEVKPQ